MAQKHSRPTSTGRAVWFTARLWELSSELPIERVKIEKIPEFDQNCWFGRDERPTLRNVAEHARQINEADLGYPIILAADGRLMDGGHRVCKAWISGATEIDAVRFVVDPPPDYTEET